MKTIKKFFLILLPLCILLGIGATYLLSKFPSICYEASVYTESACELSNPYIGWYSIHAYALSDTASIDFSEITKQTPGPGLVLLEFNLCNYADSSISEIGLCQLDELLAAWKSLDRQLIVRFLYDWDGNGLDTEPDTLALVLEHITQTAEIVNRYSDYIYIMQGIYVGSWGEMHTSKYMSDEDMLTLIRHLDNVIDSRIFLSVRTPKQWRTIIASSLNILSTTLLDNPLAARLGLYNDGMLGSGTDLGTYADTNVTDSASYFQAHSRQEEIAFQNILCCRVPNGGEVVYDNPYNDFDSAVSDLEAIHVSYLNQFYDASVLDKWSAAVYRGDAPFDGMNGLDYISRHLGYRYFLCSSSCSGQDLFHDSEEPILSICVKNVGFSDCYRSFDVTLTLQHTENEYSYQVPVPTDTCSWESGTETLLKIPLDPNAYAPGNYTVYLKVTDPVSECEIVFANEGEHTENGYLVGNLEVKSSPISIFSSAP